MHIYRRIHTYMYTHIYQHRRRMAAYCHTQATTAYAIRPFLRLASKANLLRSDAAQSKQSKQTQSLQKKKTSIPLPMVWRR